MVLNCYIILSLTRILEESTPLHWSYQKDEDGNYIPGTVCISFKETQLEEALIEFIDTKERQKELSNEIAKHEHSEQLDIEHISLEDKVRLENKFKMLLEYLKKQ